jgi:hypothetical protein
VFTAEEFLEAQDRKVRMEEHWQASATLRRFPKRKGKQNE